MAKHGKALPARKPREDDSPLIRSAESLGRMIGSLQRQLDDATKRLAGDGVAKRFRPKQAKSASKSGATKIRSTEDRKSKRASKSAAAKKTAGRSPSTALGTGRSGASRRSRKAARGA